MKKIILASASPRRRELLETAGIPFSVCPSKAEENITTSEPGRAVEELSEQKCREVFERTEGDVLVIGADTVVAAFGKILGKPKDSQEAEQMLHLFRETVMRFIQGLHLWRGKTGKSKAELFTKELG